MNNNDALAQAYLFFQHGELEAAHTILQPLSQQRSADFNLLHLAGGVCAGLGRHIEAIDLYRRALRLSPGDPAVNYKLGRILYETGRRQEALGVYLELIAAGVEHADIYLAAAVLLREFGRREEAVQTLEHALRLAPQNPDIWHLHAVVLAGLQRPEDALDSLQQAIALAPERPHYHLDIAFVLHGLHRDEEALACADKAVQLEPRFADAWISRAASLSRLCRYEESIASNEKALGLQPGDADAGVNLALNNMTLGRLGEAWPIYEARWQGELVDPERHRQIPRWTGAESLDGKFILLWSEQGLGDTIQFCRYALLAAASGAQVVLEAPDNLKRLLQTLSADGSIAVRAIGENLPEVDLQSPLMSLPLAFGTRMDTIPASSPYLYADPEKREYWRQALGTTPRMRIGIVSSGNARNQKDLPRSIPLELFAPLFGIAGIEFFLLQPEVRQHDHVFLQSMPAVRWPGKELREFDDTAALIANLDLVISVDTAVAHLAGAMDVPVWILLPQAADWRWFLERDDSPWYPSARLFRQEERGDWAGVIARAQTALISRLAQCD
ncbi:tetratricopeptide repeat protein [Herbaspirillum sp. RV1423]|uniref:tetratricopeptide repeat protein n=1 Tax=Herbaspirillum sp. RV1423 TaxID=1443993 RepID=UPI000557F75E|nr:tetratricopeptide repeat protein [Herbaspirillum sp. RV1423]